MTQGKSVGWERGGILQDPCVTWGARPKVCHYRNGEWQNRVSPEAKQPSQLPFLCMHTHRFNFFWKKTNFDILPFMAADNIWQGFTNQGWAANQDSIWGGTSVLPVILLTVVRGGRIKDENRLGHCCFYFSRQQNSPFVGTEHGWIDWFCICSPDWHTFSMSLESHGTMRGPRNSFRSSFQGLDLWDFGVVRLSWLLCSLTGHRQCSQQKGLTCFVCVCVAPCKHIFAPGRGYFSSLPPTMDVVKGISQVSGET